MQCLRLAQRMKKIELRRALVQALHTKTDFPAELAEVLEMRALGWDYWTYISTPRRIIEDMLLVQEVINEYQEQQKPQ